MENNHYILDSVNRPQTRNYVQVCLSYTQTRVFGNEDDPWIAIPPLRPNLVSWWSKKQIIVARSIIVAEYQSIASSTADFFLLRHGYVSFIVEYTVEKRS